MVAPQIGLPVASFNGITFMRIPDCSFVRPSILQGQPQREFGVKALWMSEAITPEKFKKYADRHKGLPFGRFEFQSNGTIRLLQRGYERALRQQPIDVKVAEMWSTYEVHRIVPKDEDLVAGAFNVYSGSQVSRSMAVNMTWFEAAGFAAAIGGRLPQEKEWEAAARAGMAYDGVHNIPHYYDGQRTVESTGEEDSLKMAYDLGTREVGNISSDPVWEGKHRWTESGFDPLKLRRIAAPFIWEWMDNRDHWTSTNVHLELRGALWCQANNYSRELRGGPWKNTLGHRAITHHSLAKPDTRDPMRGFRVVVDEKKPGEFPLYVK